MVDAERAERWLDEGLDALEREDAATAAESVERLRRAGQETYASRLEGALACARGDLSGAAAIFRRAIEQAPDDSELRYAWAELCEELGDLDEMARQLVLVRQLDAEADRRAGAADPSDLDFLEQVAAETLAGLPPRFSERLAHVPIVLVSRPSVALVREGFDPRAYGLFEGPGLTEDVEAPTRIVLFARNLIADFSDREELAQQIAITVLHEVGHYFGMSEADMERLGLD